MLVLRAVALFRLTRRRYRKAIWPAAAAASRTGLRQASASSVSSPPSHVWREMQASATDKPSMFANASAVFEGELTAERPPFSSS